MIEFLPSALTNSARRVLFVTNMWPEAARPWYGTFIKTQAESLEGIGVAVDVLYARGYLGWEAYGKAAAAVPRIAAGGAYDVVHGHYGHSGLIGRLQRRHPYVVSYCGNDLLMTPGAESLPRRARYRSEIALFRQVARVCAATITKSEEMERQLPRASRSRNFVIPNGVDLEHFHRIPREVAREQLDWPQEELAVLFVGNPAERRKNFALAEAVCERLAARAPALRLRVAWRVPHDDVRTWMSAADALLFTSSCEGSPNVIKEAMAAELPIVATPVGDVEERLRGLPGCFVRPPSVEALADALAVAVRHGPVAEARAAVLDLSHEKVARRVNAVYDLAIGGAAPSPLPARPPAPVG